MFDPLRPKNRGYDTVKNAEKLVESIESYEDFKTAVIRSIGYSNDVILNLLLTSDKCASYIENIKRKDEMHYGSYMNRFLLEHVLRKGDAPEESKKNIVRMILALLDKEFNLDHIPYDNLRYDENIADNIIHTKDLDYVLNHMMEVTNKELSSRPSYDKEPTMDERLKYIKQIIEKHMDRQLDEEEIKCLSSAIQDELDERKEMYEEQSNMSRCEERCWRNWLTDANYHSYDDYPVKEQVEIWNMFANSQL